MAAVDSGLLPFDRIADILRTFKPHYVGLSSLSCEDDLLHSYARLAKTIDPNVCVVAGGPHSLVASESLLEDFAIACVVIGEGEQSLIGLLERLEEDGDLAEVKGVVFRQSGVARSTGPVPYIENLDALPLPAWDLVDFRGYARFRNWSGEQKEQCHAPLLTSRGCPFGCYFCHNVFGKKVRMRSPEHVLEEMLLLKNRFGIKEIHVVDDVFNIDVERVRQICELIINSKLGIWLSFPNGLRADIMTEELIKLLRRAGTYRINYGFETSSERLQKMIGKHLDIPKAVETVRKTAAAGIFTGAYFMFGFPSQTRDEILADIDFATRSKLDAAYFFKATAYPGSRFYDVVHAREPAPEALRYADYHFYSIERSHSEIHPAELNRLLLLAQRKFYLRPSRLWRIFRKSTRKTEFIRRFIAVLSLLLQSYLLKHFQPAGKEVT